ncbi:hypothetical protein BGZ99_001705 [Dissophora globulifera]|uniref:DUF6589 domain-containing protein n=1 Tax=Dissophora globulifera TaxID=979702 RepID=A0A9P6UK71_9FUNG|nr:hypothetical protein BGZ99_001705 [Dissophora globulifera]
MGLHLRGVSAPKRLIQLLSMMGLCMSYTTTTRCLKSLARDSIKAMQRAASKKPVIFLYDNFNRRVTHRHQRKDNQDYFESATTGTIVIGEELGEERLPNDPPAIPSVADVMINSKDMDHYKCIFRSHFVGNLQGCKYNSPFLSTFDIPAIKSLDTKRSKAYELAAMDIDQASVTGNLQVLNHMRRTLNRTKGSFKNLKMIIAGDHLTISRIQTIQERSIGEATYFDLMRWAIPVLQLFHMQMILCSTILNTHFGHISQPGSLGYYIPLLGRRQLNKDMPCYYTADDFLRIIFGALVNRLWRVKEEVYLRNPSSTAMSVEIFEEEINTILNGLLIKSTTLSNTFSATNANAILFIRDMAVYIEFCAAIKAGDVGRIEEILKRITIMFQAGNHRNYGLELLRFRYNIRHVWSAARKDAIFSSLLMNTKGQGNHWIPSDLYQEHNNLLTKQTHTTMGNKMSTMSYITPNIRLFQEVASKIDKEFKLSYNNAFHRPTSRTQDIQHVLRSLEEHNILGEDPHPIEHQEHPYTKTLVMDLMVEGLVKLVHGGYNKFIKRMQEEKLGEEIAMDRDLDGLMKELDEEVTQAGKYLDETFK